MPTKSRGSAVITARTSQAGDASQRFEVGFASCSIRQQRAVRAERVSLCDRHAFHWIHPFEAKAGSWPATAADGSEECDDDATSLGLPVHLGPAILIVIGALAVHRFGSRMLSLRSRSPTRLSVAGSTSRGQGAGVFAPPSNDSTARGTTLSSLR